MRRKDEPMPRVATGTLKRNFRPSPKKKQTDTIPPKKQQEFTVDFPPTVPKIKVTRLLAPFVNCVPKIRDGFIAYLHQKISNYKKSIEPPDLPSCIDEYGRLQLFMYVKIELPTIKDRFINQ